MKIILEENCRIQTKTATHIIYQATEADAEPISSNGELSGYSFKAKFFKGVTHDLQNVVVVE